MQDLRRVGRLPALELIKGHSVGRVVPVGAPVLMAWTRVWRRATLDCRLSSQATGVVRNPTLENIVRG